ncbi:hypothetical protein PUV54_09565 [Hyphococcus flavus]|uniref:Uncharacterized protein n=1 Tax=Hyphococcus flavus TaxID=1866326 RepID=A0AAF0CG16_9PROT|nr:hypothetical protein [Hyphococcus flavus]WDI30207.1 hypothetical protein PUV54_09565 [Hyphococcus flavus]
MRRLAIIFFFLVTACSHGPYQTQAGIPVTEWAVKPAPGLDAVLLIGAMSGDKLQSSHYPDEIAKYKATLSEEAGAALDRIGVAFSAPGQGLAGPSFAFPLGAVSDLSVDGVYAVLADPKPFFQGLNRELSDERLRQLGDLRTVYDELRQAGFAADWENEVKPVAEERASLFRNYLAGYDIIPEQERYLGRSLEKRIEVLLLHYNRPYGIRVHGQRFATYHGWDEADTLRVAVHEMFHPPFDGNNATLRQAGARIAVDPLINNIIDTADPAWGYSSLGRLVDEDSTQALDMIVSLRLGLDRDPGEYWREQDNGMHLLAAAMYDAMVETGFAETGGVYEEWLIEALSSEILSPAAVERRARKVVGDAAVDKWLPDNSKSGS